MSSIVDINKLRALVSEYKYLSDSSLSFLEIINMEKSETTISLILKYLFENDNDCLKNVINTIYNKNISKVEIDNIITEYFIYEDKRIDIFIQANIGDEDAIVIIENKINSHEHGNQCQKYYDYIESRFSSIPKRYYLYLKPSWNPSKPSCQKFKEITYDVIYKCITNEEDIYIQDFKKCIERNYMSNQKNELDLYILKNFNYMYNKVFQLNKEIVNFLTHDVEEAVKAELSCGNTEFYSGTHYTLRFYDDDCRYDNNDKDKMYYFYVEVVAHDKDVNKFKFCRVVQAFSKNYNSRINRYVKKFKKDKLVEYGNNIWYVVDSNDFETNKSILSSEWKNELICAAKSELKRMYADMRNCVNEFKDVE